MTQAQMRNVTLKPMAIAHNVVAYFLVTSQRPKASPDDIDWASHVYTFRIGDYNQQYLS